MKVTDKSGADLSRTSISSNLSTFLSNQVYVLQFCLINCEAVVVKSFLLVNTRTFQNNPIIKASNHKANCLVNKRNFLLWCWLTLENKNFCSTCLHFADRASTYQWKLFHLSDFLRQSVYLSGYLFPFFRQTVTLSGYLPN